MIPTEKLSLVTFDVGGTLIRPFPSVGAIYSEVLTRRGFAADPERTEGAFEEAWDEAARIVPPDRERYSWSPEGERGYWRRLLAGTVARLGGGEPPPGAAEELFERFGHRETWRLYPEVRGALERIAARGITMAVVSNWDSRLPALLRELGIRHYFGPILVSALEGYEKPDPRIFHAAAARAGVRPGQVLHVGDRQLEDIEGARRAGCQWVRIERNGGAGEGIVAVLRRLEMDADRERTSN
ncbi:MAG TPA: HAD-IA family hydrolase [Candidatus Polarisedimenticolia bacterium]|jgi:putative hydrolase of the HAD superfamily|nr:HAD-IA family hydrolase [Candidatus Polarisedimenticolia bacterium]